MRFLALLSLLSLPLAAQPAAFGSVEPKVMLEAIRLVENTEGWGSHTEYGPHQMIASVRKRVGGYDEAAAQRWLVIVCRDLRTSHVDVNPHSIALVWNGGIGSLRRGTLKLSTYHYANRVVATYNSLLVAHPTIHTATPIFPLTIRQFLIPSIP